LIHFEKQLFENIIKTVFHGNFYQINFILFLKLLRVYFNDLWYMHM